MGKILKSFRNDDCGVMSVVMENDSKYIVRLRDTDFEEYLNTCVLFDNLEEAIDYAKKCIM